jgi:thiosulfate oxidation carrier complex protein SoxZ
MSITRRTFLRASVSGVAVSTSIAAGVLAPRGAGAALPPETFFAPSPAAAVGAVLGDGKSMPDPAVELDVPGIADAADMVPLSVSTTLDNVESITIVADKNPNPVVATYRLDPQLEPYIATRIRLAQSGDVNALVMADKAVHRATKNVEVSISGCGDPEPEGKPSAQAQTMSHTIRMKATKDGDGVIVRALITHPMTPPRKPKAPGAPVDGNFIQEVTAEVNGKKVLHGDWSAGVSQNPYLSFKVREAKPGDVIRLSWTDSSGHSDSTQVVVES